MATKTARKPLAARTEERHSTRTASLILLRLLYPGVIATVVVEHLPSIVALFGHPAGQ